jgi:phage terminase large subunit
MQIKFPTGSTIIFKGMDKPEKVKSINGVSIVWLEECSEIKYAGYKELLGRIRTPNVSMHFILSCNPIGRENWVYRHFFVRLDDEGEETVIVDEEKFYDKKCIVKNGTYYHHSTPDDNPWLPWQYMKRLDDLKNYDYPLYMVARWGRFGATGTRVLPQLIIAKEKAKFKAAIEKLGPANQYFGFDFGFEESYNAVISMSVDLKRGILYIWDEIYMNKVTDDIFANQPEMQSLRERLNTINEQGYAKMIVADNEDPKAITYYRQNGFKIRGCRNKFAGSRLSNTRKVKRFRKIVVSPKCKNVIRELKDLTYKKDAKGNVIYDQFNIDPHSFSAIWYALDGVTVADIKEKNFNSKAG